MRIRLNLKVGTKSDALALLERAAHGCGHTVPHEIVGAYQMWLDAVEVAYGDFRCSSFGPNDVDQLSDLIDYNYNEITGGVLDATSTIYMSSAVLKVFRDYFAYVLAAMPLGTSVYWKPSVKPQLMLVVSDESRPKGYVKLI